MRNGLALSFLIFCFLPSISYADNCIKGTLDFGLTEYASFYKFEGKDNDTDEDITRYYYNFDDGDQLTIEHKYCLIDNYLVNYSSIESSNSKIITRVTSFINSISNKNKLRVSDGFLGAWVVGDPKLEGYINSTVNEKIEVYSSVFNHQDLVFNRIFSLYIAVGGED